MVAEFVPRIFCNLPGSFQSPADMAGLRGMILGYFCTFMQFGLPGTVQGHGGRWIENDGHTFILHSLSQPFVHSFFPQGGQALRSARSFQA